MISALSIAANTIFRSSFSLISNVHNFSTNTQPLYFKATQTLLGEPLKKKKRLDPAIVRAREERQRKKLEKKIRSLEKLSHHMKPIYEVETLHDLVVKSGRVPSSQPQLSTEETRERLKLHNEWSKYKMQKWREDRFTIKSIMRSQEIALAELKAASIELYENAMQIDDAYLPHNTIGPVHTPPIDNYDSPDGEYADLTVKYYGE